MIPMYIILGVILLSVFLPKMFHIKCPKCNKECEESWYLPGCEDSLYHECPEHGDINKFDEASDNMSPEEYKKFVDKTFKK